MFAYTRVYLDQSGDEFTIFFLHSQGENKKGTSYETDEDSNERRGLCL